MTKENGWRFGFLLTNRLILRVSESRSNAVTEPVEVPSIDYAEREQNHEGEARIIDDLRLWTLDFRLWKSLRD